MNRQQEYQDLMIELENTPAEMTQVSSKTKTRARRRNIKKYTIIPTGTLMTALLMLVLAVNLSLTVAFAFEQIPVLRQIAAAVNFSPSLSEAIRHEFIQHIGQEQTIDNITMRVEYVIVDQRQLNIFYTLDSLVYSYMVSWPNILCAKTGSFTQAAVTNLGGVITAGTIRQSVVHFFNDQMPSQLIMETQVHIVEGLYMVSAEPVQAPSDMEFAAPEIIATFTFALEFDPTFTEQGETIYVNQEFVIDGQLLTLTTVEIYPTHMRANFSADPDNTAWLTSLSFHARNERGRRFDAASGGIVAFGHGDSPMISSHLLNSPFFAESNHLSLFIEEVIWLDKDMERVRIDLAGGTAEILPEGVTLYEARRDGSSWRLSFEVLERAENHNHQVFGGRFYDENGNVHHFNSWSSGSLGDGSEVFFVGFTLVNFPYDVVYLTPVYSRVVRLHEPISLTIR